MKQAADEASRQEDALKDTSDELNEATVAEGEREDEVGRLNVTDAGVEPGEDKL